MIKEKAANVEEDDKVFLTKWAATEQGQISMKYLKVDEK